MQSLLGGVIDVDIAQFLCLAECQAIYCSAARQAGANYIGSSVLTALVVRLVDTVYKPLLCTNTPPQAPACMSPPLVVMSDMPMR